MKRFMTLAIVATILASDNGFAQGDKKGAGKLDGAWTATSWQRGDGIIGKDAVKTELTIKNNAYEFPTGINTFGKNGTFKLDEAKGTIDITPGAGPAKGKTLLGIYKVEGNKLTLCFTSAGSPRPAEFKSTEKNMVLATYERKKGS